uniref:zinc finger and BTB domain-containing protein 12-like n=1 Tax=Myxine glutinosa TaxID=7769 RepID=UPI00358E42DC
MTLCNDVLRFDLTSASPAFLRSMNRLRLDGRLCDVTVRLESVSLRGHRVLFAACSPYLRDQFLLNPNAIEVRISLPQDPRVGFDLLLSCYTGRLEVPTRDLLAYLTAASYLQMDHVVERCTQALGRYIQPLLSSRNTGILKHRKVQDDFRKWPNQAEMDYEPDKASASPISDGSNEQKPEGPQQLPDCTVPWPQAGLDDEGLSCVEGHTAKHGADESHTVDIVAAGCEADESPQNFCMVKLEVLSDDEIDETGSLGKVSGGVGDCSINTEIVSPARDDYYIHSTLDTKDTVADDSIEEPYREYVSSAGRSTPTQEAESTKELPGVTYLQMPTEDAGFMGTLPEQSEDVAGKLEAVANGRGKVTRSGRTLPLRLLMPSLHHKAPISSSTAITQRHFECGKCLKGFSHIEGLWAHMRSHKIFLCPRCGREFTQSSNLTRHLRIHTGVKPFACNLCGRCFTQKSSLQDHMNLHSGDRPHRCRYCRAGFAHKPALRRHLREQHNKSCAENALQDTVGRLTPLNMLTAEETPVVSETRDYHKVCSSEGQFSLRRPSWTEGSSGSI